MLNQTRIIEEIEVMVYEWLCCSNIESDMLSITNAKERETERVLEREVDEN